LYCGRLTHHYTVCNAADWHTTVQCVMQQTDTPLYSV
jgi:hypothetical protein